MSGSENTTEWAPRLEDVVAEYERRAELGQPPDTTELVDRHPDLAAELEEYFDNRAAIEQIAAPLRIAVNGPDRIRDFGDYEVLEEIGRGGMAVVYKARQKSLGRLVALKFILSGPYAGAEDLTSFRDDARCLADLQHTNIVEIHEFDEHDDLPYLCLEFMEGGSLAQRIADGVPRPNRKAAQLLRTLARAVHYAHQHRIIHRDLKPANVLFSGKGDEDVAKIADFGLAKRLDDETGTRTEAVVGTVNYMSPEQVDSKCGSIGPATDVWALGVILYQLLTGRPPFQSAMPNDTLEQVVDHDPVTPRRLNRKVDRDLETICLKCLKKEPQNRYSSSRNLAEDFQAYLDGKPLPHASVWERTIKWIRRRPALAASLVCSVVFAVMAIGFAYQSISVRRAHAVEKAWEAIGKYRLDEAKTAVQDAEAYGASGEQLGTIRGWLAVIRGRPREAIVQLKEAGTETVTALAILAIAYNNAGEFGNYEDTLAELEKLEPSTSRDYLLMAQAQSFADPMRGLQTAAVAIHLHDSIVARLIRAEIQTIYATLHADPNRAEEACQDARIAKEMSGNKPVTLSASAKAHLVAARLFKGTDQHQRHLEYASADVQALADFAPLPVAAIARWSYFDYLEKENDALDALRLVNKQDRNPWIAQLYALALYRQSKFDEALDTLKEIENRGEGTVFFALARAHVLAEQPGDGLTEARDAVDTVEGRDGLFAVFLSATLYY